MLPMRPHHISVVDGLAQYHLRLMPSIARPVAHGVRVVAQRVVAQTSQNERVAPTVLLDTAIRRVVVDFDTKKPSWGNPKRAWVTVETENPFVGMTMMVSPTLDLITALNLRMPHPDDKKPKPSHFNEIKAEEDYYKDEVWEVRVDFYDSV